MTQTRPLILVTNDDGYDAPGIQHLTDVAREFGDVFLIGPMSGQSAMSHAVTLHQPLRLKEISIEDGLTVVACSGTPADCVKIGLNQLLSRKPDLIVSGINHGSNSSVSLFYSGTVAAAIEGCMNGIPSVAFSVDDHSKNADFRLAVKYARSIIAETLKNGLPSRTCLNVNFPKIPPEECEGIKVCRQTMGVWKEEFDHRVDPQGKEYFWLTGYFHNEESNETDTDDWVVQHNMAAIVPIKVDITDYQALKALENWNLDNHTP